MSLAASGWRGLVLLASTLACLLAAILLPVTPQPLAYHAFADDRALSGIPNALNVLSNLPFLIAGFWGLGQVLGGDSQFAAAREKIPYLIFFLGATLTCFGSAYYHLAPDNARLVWDRLPMTLGFSGLVAAALDERVSSRLGERLLAPLLLLGLFTVLYWKFTEEAGVGNLVPYAVFQGWAVLTIVLLLVLFPARRFTHGNGLAWAALWYGLAKLAEIFDAALFQWLGGVVSGHSLKHVLAGMSVFAIVWQLRLRRPLSPG